MQPFQAEKKSVTPAELIRGKLVRPLQPFQVVRQEPATVIAGKLVRPEQPLQAVLKFVPLEVSINGKLVSSLQPIQVLLKI